MSLSPALEITSLKDLRLGGISDHLGYHHISGLLQ